MEELSNARHAACRPKRSRPLPLAIYSAADDQGRRAPIARSGSASAAAGGSAERMRTPPLIRPTCSHTEDSLDWCASSCGFEWTYGRVRAQAGAPCSGSRLADHT
ncbi:hypothetical protein HYH03_008509 [Edaphochlamys debaryana]|uniref:Uncharacterized protein n=1 Tax=Edaphochlamys debaryana TaxID=47281 RepID=A0A836BYX2_9CHLO|nr:hypothetical protein HYH03_008509 [Edaphochlamys debaryana]|eukprot:KAG2493377.1 hypothetical protein HYH03_008509 [Edaphochlamys debaryana]